MPDENSTPGTINRRRKKVFVTGSLIFLAILFLWFVRRETNGIRNFLSVRYWISRAKGEDLYDPAQHYLKRGRRDLHQLLLTFDDGPDPSSTPEILRILKQRKVPAAFFVIGRRVKLYPELVRAILKNGDELGNHTQDHLRLDTLTPSQVRNEIKNCEVNVRRAAGVKMTLLRPPGMRFNDKLDAQFVRMGYTLIGWNVGAKDFIPDQKVTDMTAEDSKRLNESSDQIAKNIVSQARDGAIILLHDEAATAMALPKALSELQGQGYEFVSTQKMLSEMPHPVAVVSNPPADRLAARP